MDMMLDEEKKKQQFGYQLWYEYESRLTECHGGNGARNKFRKNSID